MCTYSLKDLEVRTQVGFIGMKSLLTGNTDGQAVVQIVAESNTAEQLHIHTHSLSLALSPPPPSHSFSLQRLGQNT